MIQIELGERVTINVDGSDYSVPKGANVIEAMNAIGKDKEVPALLLPP